MSLGLLLRNNRQPLSKAVEHKFYSRIISGRLPPDTTFGMARPVVWFYAETVLFEAPSGQLWVWVPVPDGFICSSPL